MVVHGDSPGREKLFREGETDAEAWALAETRRVPDEEVVVVARAVAEPRDTALVVGQRSKGDAGQNEHVERDVSLHEDRRCGLMVVVVVVGLPDLVRARGHETAEGGKGGDPLELETRLLRRVTFLVGRARDNAGEVEVHGWVLFRAKQRRDERVGGDLSSRERRVETYPDRRGNSSSGSSGSSGKAFT